jgi:hypothetical protein
MYCKEIYSHVDDLFPQIPDTHIYECQKIIWKMTYRLAGNAPVITILQASILNLPPFKKHQQRCAIQDTTSVLLTSYSEQKLLATFVNWQPKEGVEVYMEEINNNYNQSETVP